MSEKLFLVKDSELKDAVKRKTFLATELTPEEIEILIELLKEHLKILEYEDVECSENLLKKLKEVSSDG